MSSDNKNSTNVKDSNSKTSTEINIKPQTPGENNAKSPNTGENNAKSPNAGENNKNLQTSVETNTKPQTAGDNNQTPKPSIFSSFKSDKPVQSFFASKPDPSKLMINPFLNRLDKNDDKSTSKPEGGFKFESPHTKVFSFGR